jgi:flagella basal body P-ring formation protein FlgA
MTNAMFTNAGFTSTMVRRLAVLLGAAMLLGTPVAAAAPALRASVTVSAPIVRLGDLFVDAGKDAAVEIAPAPDAGQRTTYDARWLAAIAKEHHLAWMPGSDYDQVVVERASRAIGSDTIVSKLLAAIATTQPVDNAVIQLDNGGPRLIVPAEADDSVTIDGLTIDPRSGRLSALISAPAGDANAPRQRVVGRLFFQVDMPVLNRSLSPGETITADDLGHRLMRRDQVGPDAVTDASALIGKTPRRALRADDMVRSGDVQVPIIVHKNDLVTIILDTPSLHLSTQAKALDDGAMGAAIRVSNTSSNRVVDAIVRGANTVSVSLPAATVAAAVQPAIR